MPLVATLICVASLVVLVIAETRRHRFRFLFKPLASAAFIAVAVLGGAVASGEGSYGIAIVVGLVLGAGGDVALMWKSDRAFLTGLVLFLLGHLAYVVAFALLASPSQWLSLWSLLPLAAAAAVLRYLWPHLGKMRVPVIVYTVVIGSMVITAVAAFQHGPLTARAGWFMLVGAVLFFGSDIAVARERFVAPGAINRIWGLPAYYGGQLLIAWSAITG